MRKWLLIAAFVALGLSLAVAAGIFGLYRASQHVPVFYQEALKTDPKVQKQASDEMVREGMALASEVEKGGKWQAVFTAEQINGWLAVDLARNYPDLLPSGVSNPRVAIEPEQMRIACQLDRKDWSGVLWMAVEVYLAEPNVVALRIRDARVGVLPLPLDAILDRISERASQMDLQIRWRQAEGDPVAEIPIPSQRDADDKVVRIETLRLGEGNVCLSGSTERP